MHIEFHLETYAEAKEAQRIISNTKARVVNIGYDDPTCKLYEYPRVQLDDDAKAVIVTDTDPNRVGQHIAVLLPNDMPIDILVEVLDEPKTEVEDVVEEEVTFTRNADGTWDDEEGLYRMFDSTACGEPLRVTFDIPVDFPVPDESMRHMTVTGTSNIVLGQDAIVFPGGCASLRSTEGIIEPTVESITFNPKQPEPIELDEYDEDDEDDDWYEDEDDDCDEDTCGCKYVSECLDGIDEAFDNLVKIIKGIGVTK